MLKKALSVILVLALVFVIFSGCAKTKESDNSDKTNENTSKEPDVSDQTAATGETEQLNKEAQLKIWFSLFPEENKELQAIADEFTKETGVKVQVLDNNFFEIRQKYPIAAASADAPDLILAQAADLGTLVEADTLRPIEFVDQQFADRFVSVAIDAFKYKGKLYGVGYSADAYGIVYNKKLISEPPKTWDEFFKKAEELTVKDSKGNITQYGFLIDPTNYWFIYPLIERHGGYYFGKNPDGSFNPDDIGVANEGSVKAFEELLALKKKGLTTQTSEENDSIVSQRFAEGKVAMIIYALWYAQSYKDNNINYGYAPLPNNNDGTASKPLGSIMGIMANKNSKYPKESDAFFKYMMKDEHLQRLYEAANGKEAKNGQRNTLNKSVYNSNYVQSDANLKMLADVGMSSQVFPSNPEATVIWNYSKQALDNIFFNNKPVADALKEFEAKIKEDISKMKR
ncbi:MAG: extracellular solute-binding protein [Firmicutes bacterium]|nr:extracellular solute-binding protein [Bacillota bacterium]